MRGMAEEESGPRRRGFVETLREGWKPAQRRGASGDAKTTETPTTEKSMKPTEEVAGTKSGNGTTAESGAEAKSAGTKSPATKTDATPTGETAAVTRADRAAKEPKPNLEERMEGLQGWMAEIERKQRRMTLFGGILTVLAAAAAGVALYFAIATPNTATKDDVDDLQAQVETLQQQVTQATTDQNRLKALNATIQSLNTRVAAAEQRANQSASEIAAVKAQAQAAQQAATAAQQAATAAQQAAAATPAPAPLPGKTKP
jgi:hypothetical protein